MKGRDTATGWSTEMGWNFRGQHGREQRWKQLPRTIMRRLGTCLYVVREREREIPKYDVKVLVWLVGFLVFVFCLEKSNTQTCV